MPNIALFIPWVSSYSLNTLDGVATVAGNLGGWEIEPFTRMDDLAAWSGDGMIAATVVDDERYAAIHRPGIPLVNISAVEGNGPAPTVCVDNVAVGVLAADDLMACGLRRFGYVYSGDFTYSRLRLRGFEERITRALRGTVSVLDMGAGWSGQRETPAARAQLDRWLAKLKTPIGLFVERDVAAARVLQACQRVGLTVPDDVAVLGVDDEVALCGHASPPLSSIDIDMHGIGAAAATLLHRMLTGEPPPRRPILLPPKRVVRRRSTDAMAVQDALVARAMRLTREQATSGLSVPELADAVGVSRSLLDKRFVAAIGRTPKAVILSIQIARARELLRSTRWPVARVAKACGIPDPNYFAVVFRRETGTSPTAYSSGFLQ
jgi:LacI family transcriptional regulator